MPRPAKGARIWFDPKAKLYYIRDGSLKRGTGCGIAERAGAEGQLRAYIEQKYEPPTDSRPSRLLVDDILTFYAREIAPGQKSQATSYSMERLLDWWSGKALSDVKRSTCEAYVAHRMTQPIRQATKSKEPKLVSQETARRELTVLRAAINAYHAETPLDALPVVTLPEAAPPKTRWLSRKEAARLLRAAWRLEDKDSARALSRFILIGLYTGTRSGAIRKLGWLPNTVGGHIDLNQRIIYRRSDGERDNRKRRPAVRIPDRLYGSLDRWRRQDMGGERKVPFVIHYRGRMIEKQRKSWAAACLRAGLGSDVTPHILRHTCVTWMMLDSQSAFDVGHYVGMSHQMIEDVYGHHSPEHQGKIASSIGRRRT